MDGIGTDTVLNPFFLDELLTTLRNKGFSVDIDDYVIAVQIEQQIKSQKITADQIKYALAAIVCCNEQEQKQFYTLFEGHVDQKKKEQEAARQLLQDQIDLIEKKERDKQRRIILVSIFTLSVLSILFAFLVPIFKTDFYNGRESDFFITRRKHDTTNDSLQLSALGSYNPNRLWATHQTLYQRSFSPRYDTTGLRADWNLQDTVIYASKTIRYKYNKPGYKTIHAELSISGTSKMAFDDSLFVCEESPIIKPPEDVYLNEKVSFVAQIPIDRPIHWKIDEKDTITKNQTLAYTFTQAGSHSLSCKYEDQICPHEGVNTITVNVMDKDVFTITNNQSGQPYVFTYYHLSPLYYILLILLGLLLLCGLLLLLVPFLYKLYEKSRIKYLEKENKNKEDLYFNDTQSFVATGKKPPLDIRFYNKDILIKGRDGISKLALDLKKRIESEHFGLHLKKSIQASIKNFGLFTPVHENKNVTRDYLVLIDESYAKSPQVKLFHFLADQLLVNQVELESYYFSKEPVRVYKKSFDNAINIDYLKNHHYQSILMVFGNGYNFLDTNFPEVYSPFKKTFSYWPKRLLITPVPSMDWSLNEKILASFFHIVPADVIGLSAAIKELRKGDYTQKAVNTNDYTTYEAKFVEFEEVDGLRKYINNNSIFQWVASIAVYPKITWEIILSLGEALGKDLVTYDNLLKVCRIDWIQQGSFPTRIRLELLKELDYENEITARKTIIRLLEEDSEKESDSFSDNERAMQLVVNKFALYSTSRPEYAHYQKEEKEFLTLYRDKKLRDIPLKVYLQGNDPDKPTENWENILKGGLENYYNKRVGAQPPYSKAKKIKRQLRNAVLLLVLPLIVMGYIGLINPEMPPLGTYQSSYYPQWVIILNKDSCFKKFGPTNLAINNESGSTLLDTVITSIDTVVLYNYERIHGSVLNFTLSSDQKNISGSFIVDSTQSRISILGGTCINTPILKDTVSKDTIYIQYNDSSLKQTAHNLRRMLVSFNYHIGGISETKMSNGNEIHYYESLKRNVAQNLRSVIKNFIEKDFEIKKYDMSIPEKKTHILKIFVKNTKDGPARHCLSLKSSNQYVIYFDKNKLDPPSKILLDDLVSNLINNSSQSLIINCYSSYGSEAYALKVGEQYGKEIVDYLQQHKANTFHTMIKSYGKEHPQTACSERVEIIVQELPPPRELIRVDVFTVGVETHTQKNMSLEIIHRLRGGKKFNPRERIFPDSNNIKQGYQIYTNQIRYEANELKDAEELRNQIYEVTGKTFMLREVKYTQTSRYLSVFIVNENPPPPPPLDSNEILKKMQQMQQKKGNKQQQQQQQIEQEQQQQEK